jgi:3',5'-cyclic AMP phosphodiesterase CpdA
MSRKIYDMFLAVSSNNNAHLDIRMNHSFKILLFISALTLLACNEFDSGNTDAPVDSDVVSSLKLGPAVCDNMSAEAFVTRNELATGSRPAGASLLLRFVHLTDDHIIDDDGQLLNGASALDPLYTSFESAQRFQEEYSDEVLNDLISALNNCHAQYPAEFAIVTGDSADLTTVAETRRFIDNLDGRFDQMSAFEEACALALGTDAPAEQIDLSCTRFTGRGTADTQTIDPDIEDPAYQFLPTRTVLQVQNTQQAATSGRAADGSVDPARQTVTRSPGLPEILRCDDGADGCINQTIAMPWFVAFGNHDGYTRGTVAADVPLNEVSQLTGRRYMFGQRDFIQEFFKSSSQPLGHGFGFVDTARLEDEDDRNDGYYAFDAGEQRFRMIVLNTIIDGRDPRVPTAMLRNPFALSDGSLDLAQFEWLKTELAAAHLKQQLVMVFSHHPDLTFAEYGMFADLLTLEVSAIELNAELASWPNMIAWVAGHTHVHRVRAFAVDDGVGSNGEISAPVSDCHGQHCGGFWQIETASLIDHPQQQRLIEVFDNGDGSGTIRGPVLSHSLTNPQRLAAADDRCALYLTDPAAVQAAISEANLDALCTQGGQREGRPEDRNVELIFAMPQF